MNAYSKNSKKSVQDLVLTAMFTAVILLMAFTPLGIIDLPLIKATLLHVPVIIGSVLLGAKKGAFFGLLFGLVSLFKNTMAPSLLSFAFSPLVPLPGTDSGTLWALVICLVPRLLVGIVPCYVHKGLTKLLGEKSFAQTVSFAVAGAAGAVINTGLVMGLIHLLLSDAFAAAQGISADAVTNAILAIVFTNGVPETIAAALLTAAVCMGVSKVLVIYGWKDKKGESK